MYSLMLGNDFIAQHFLVGKDFGQENFIHSHHYSLEIEIESENLDQYNYLVDIVEVNNALGKLTSYFKDKTLNELPEFANQNPSLELFSRIIWQRFKENVHQLPKSCQITVRLWEDETARASYRG